MAATEEDFNTEFTEDTEATEKKARILSLSFVFSVFSVAFVLKSSSRAATKFGICSTEITEASQSRQRKNQGIMVLFLRLLRDLCRRGAARKLGWLFIAFW